MKAPDQARVGGYIKADICTGACKQNAFQHAAHCNGLSHPDGAAGRCCTAKRICSAPADISSAWPAHAADRT